MKTQASRTDEPINLSSFRSETRRAHSKGVEQHYQTATALVAVLVIATVVAFLTLPPANSQNSNRIEQSARITFERG